MVTRERIEGEEMTAYLFECGSLKVDPLVRHWAIVLELEHLHYLSESE